LAVTAMPVELPSASATLLCPEKVLFEMLSGPD
jgi:hypothetical protein